MADSYHPPAAFSFQVTVIEQGAPNADIGGHFQEVSGIDASLDTEDTAEAGQTRFTPRLPTAAKHPNLVLKRGAIRRKSLLADWAQGSLESPLGAAIATKTVQVRLLNSEGSPVIAWKLVNAYPVRWTVAPLQPTDDTIVVETLELSYNNLERNVL